MSRLSRLFGGESTGNFYLRDFQNARQYRPDSNPPRLSFEGYVNFVVNRSLYDSLYGSSFLESNDYRRQLGNLLKTATMPSISFKTDTKNSFNKPKIITTGITYEPVTISVYDTVGSEWLVMLMKYYSYHFMNGRNKQSANPSSDRDLAERIITGREFNSNDYGFNPNLVPNFFERMDLILYHGGKGVQYSLHNPVITSFKTGTIDYSQSNPMTFDITFEYENFILNNVLNFDLSNFDLSRFEEAGGLQGPAFEPGRKPPSLEPGNEINLSILGLDGGRATVPTAFGIPMTGRALSGEERGRSLQPRTSNASSGGVPVDDATGLDFREGSAIPYVETDRGDVYGPAARGSDLFGGNNAISRWFSDTLGGVIDTGISTALNGGNVRRAVVDTAASNIFSGIRRGVVQARQRGGG